MGDTGYDRHSYAARTAVIAIGELQDVLAVATDKAEVAHGLVQAAVGQSAVPSAINSMNYLMGAMEKIREAYEASIQSKQELERYTGGF